MEQLAVLLLIVVGAMMRVSFVWLLVIAARGSWWRRGGPCAKPRAAAGISVYLTAQPVLAARRGRSAVEHQAEVAELADAPA
jgi:hypothetical protein